LSSTKQFRKITNIIKNENGKLSWIKNFDLYVNKNKNTWIIR
jgi:hypothetical protein